jgi:putative nucleotidyltransferase with HDIG domain
MASKPLLISAWISLLFFRGDEVSVGSGVFNADDVTQDLLVETCVATQDLLVETCVRLLGMRDTESEEHSRRVARLTVELAKACGVSEDNRTHIWRGAMLHDIGKIGIPDEILLKKGPLTEAEYEIVRQHPITAFKILRTIPLLHTAMDIPYCHHEKWDGTGYPRGLKGEEIPLSARIFTVIDIWDALLSDRPYRPAWKPQDAKRYLLEQSGSCFDPKVISSFLDLDVNRMPLYIPPAL